MSYQAVLRNSSSVLIKSTTVGMRISVLQGSAAGTAVYVETQRPVTNANGLASLEIGNGNPVTGTFAGINWAAGPYFIKTETDPAGGINYTIAGTSQLMSVPYALYAANSAPGPVGPQGPAGVAGPQGATGPAGAVGATGPAGPAGQTGVAGPTGPQGPIGLTGATGPAGPAGVAGPAGPVGPAGPQGQTGATGAQGPVGPAGQGGVTTAGTNVTITGAGTVASPYVINASGGAGGLTLPYTAVQTSNNTLFDITNNNSSAISGTSINSTGVAGLSTNFSGVYGQSANINYAGVVGYNTGAGKGVEGESATTGVGVYGKSFAGFGIYGVSEHGNGVHGLSNKVNNGVGVSGVANSTGGVGVYGTANVGDGVKGYSGTGKAVHGTALNGTGLYGYSYAGYGLEIDGKVKISGANTTPGAGKVLTSDANGNATWEGGVAFTASSTHSSWQSIPAHPAERVQHWAIKEYDLGNNFDLATNTFTAPVNGIYHFDAQLLLGLSDEDEREFEIYLRRTRNTTVTKLRRGMIVAGISDDAYTVHLSTDVQLNAGDKIDLFMANSYTYTVPIRTSSEGCSFSGRLVVRL